MSKRRLKQAAGKRLQGVILSEAKNLALSISQCEILRRLRLLRMTASRGFPQPVKALHESAS